MKLSYLISKLIKKSQISAIRNSIIHKTSKVASNSHIVNSRIGKYSYIGNYSQLLNVEIGNFCSIADNCIIGGASHPIDWVSTSPVFHQGKNIMKKNFSNHEFLYEEKTVIGNDVWLGNNCLIKSGIRIGDGAIIGMGSVVTKDVGDYEIWGGNPARFIRKRFNDITIISLKNSKWWDYQEDVLQEMSKYFNDIHKFIHELERH